MGNKPTRMVRRTDESYIATHRWDSARANPTPSVNATMAVAHRAGVIPSYANGIAVGEITTTSNGSRTLTMGTVSAEASPHGIKDNDRRQEPVMIPFLEN